MTQPLIAVIMGSKSDWETMEHAAKTLDQLKIPYEVKIVSAHRTPDLLFQFAESVDALEYPNVMARAVRRICQVWPLRKRICPFSVFRSNQRR